MTAKIERVSAMTAIAYKWTADRYRQAIKAGIFEGQQIELLKGDLVIMSPEGEPHAYYSDRLAKLLQRLLGERAQVREGKPIILPDDSEPIPDIAVVQPLDVVYLEHHPYPENIFWLIEYSQTTLTKDLGIKKDIYARSGILEYWVVNLQDLQLTVFRDLRDGSYRTQFNLIAGAIAPVAFPEIELESSRLFSL